MKRLDTKNDRFWRTYVYHIIVIFGLPFLARKNINTRDAQVRTQCKIEFTYQSQKTSNFNVVLEW